jgi:hypothetical protein
MRRAPLEDDIIVPHLKQSDPHPQYRRRDDPDDGTGGGVALATDEEPTAETVGATAIVGDAETAARADHRHAMPGLATGSRSGFLSPADKTAIDTLGTAATYDVPATGDAATDEVVKGDDSRLTDARAAAAHAATHLAAGGDPLSLTNAEIAASAGIALSKLATIAASRFLGNNTGGASVPLELTPAEAAALLADWQAQLLYDFKASVVTDATASVTLAAATHMGRVLDLTSASAVTVTLPNSLPVGFSVTVIQAGAGQVTFSPASGATLRHRQSHTKTAGQYAMVTLVVRANAGGSSADYVLAGDTNP